MRSKRDIYKRDYYTVNPTTGCWEWTGQKWKGGYGYVRVTTPLFPTTKVIPAHRYMYALYKGEFDRSLDVCHSCDNPSCVNPEHLWLGTHSDNMYDMYRKKRRSQAGTLNGNFKHGRLVRDIQNALY